MNRYSKFAGLVSTLKLFVMNKVLFDKTVLGNKVKYQNKDYTIFRSVRIKGNTKEGVRLYLKFTPKMPIKGNIKFSRIAMLVFMGLPGFNSKHWCVNYDDGECLGIYEWIDEKSVLDYLNRIALRNIENRSVKESVSYQIEDIYED